MKPIAMVGLSQIGWILIGMSVHVREGYSSHFVTLSVCLSVCHFSILEKELFSGLKLTPVHSR